MIILNKNIFFYYMKLFDGFHFPFFQAVGGIAKGLWRSLETFTNMIFTPFKPFVSHSRFTISSCRSMLFDIDLAAAESN